MKSIKLLVKTGNNKYPIIIGNNIINKFGIILKENLNNFNQCLVVTDKNVPKKLIKKILISLPKKEITIYQDGVIQGIGIADRLIYCKEEALKKFPELQEDDFNPEIWG